MIKERALDTGAPHNVWRVLVVEDEYYIADDLRRALEKEGAQIIGPVPTVARALALIEEDIDFSVAVLDVKLGDEMVWPVADALNERGVGYVFATGYSPVDIPPAYRDVARFRKPVDTPSLTKSLLERREEAV